MLRIIALITFFAVPTSNAAEHSCEIKPAKFHEFMKQDFDTFDQKPNGWRSFYQTSGDCDLTIAMLIDSYHLSHQEQLVPWQDRLLSWHVGQSFGFLSLYDLAILRFQKSFDPQELPTPAFHWNAYARATIAFMKKDKVALQKAHDEFAPVAPSEINNFKIVERFIRCFDSSYFDAYAGMGTCKQLY